MIKHNINRFFFFILIFLSTSSYAVAITPLSNLSDTAKLAEQKNIPILLVFTTEGCPFCERVKADIIRPMLISGEYDQSVIIREVHVDYNNQLTGLDYQQLSSRQFAKGFSIYVYPVLTFVNSKFCEIGERIIGVNTLSLYGGRVDRGIEQGLASLKRQGKKAKLVLKKLNTKNNFCHIQTSTQKISYN